MQENSPQSRPSMLAACGIGEGVESPLDAASEFARRRDRAIAGRFAEAALVRPPRAA